MRLLIWHFHPPPPPPILKLSSKNFQNFLFKMLACSPPVQPKNVGKNILLINIKKVFQIISRGGVKNIFFLVPIRSGEGVKVTNLEGFIRLVWSTRNLL
jgi:hypothetical protein